jgi:hypothetical protein
VYKYQYTTHKTYHFKKTENEEAYTVFSDKISVLQILRDLYKL